MHARQGRPERRVRSIFISDTHLGCKYAHAEALLAFLNACRPEFLYLVGDIIDGWRLKRAWHWQPVYNLILQRLLSLATSGTRVRYTPGNHDEFLRPFVRDFGHVLGCVEIRDEFLHVAADGRRFLVLHGDLFDDVETRAPWLSLIGALAYDTLVWANSLVNRCRRWFGRPPARVRAAVKMHVKHVVTFVSNFEERLCDHAREQRCEGVICGHVHSPVIRERAGVTYCNSGDWVEHCTALVEYDDGELEIWHLPLEIEPQDQEEPGADEVPAGPPAIAVA